MTRQASRDAGAAPWLPAVGIVAAGGATALLLLDRPVAAAVAVAVCGGALAVAAARTIEARSARLRFAQAVTERVCDAVILGAVAWVWVEDDAAISAAALTALGLSYLGAYLRAKAVGLGFRMTDQWMEQYVHFGLVSAGLFLEPGLLVLLWLAAAIDLQAAIRVAIQVGRQRETG